MKYDGNRADLCNGVSHPSRGAWIEMYSSPHHYERRASHPSRGAWIEISLRRELNGAFLGRTPRGVRGLKSCTTSAT